MKGWQSLVSTLLYHHKVPRHRQLQSGFLEENQHKTKFRNLRDLLRDLLSLLGAANNVQCCCFHSYSFSKDEKVQLQCSLCLLASHTPAPARAHIHTLRHTHTYTQTHTRAQIPALQRSRAHPEQGGVGGKPWSL